MRDGFDEPFIAERFEGPARGVTGDTEEIDEIFLGRERIFAGAEFAGFDPGSQPRSDLPVRRQGAA
jgi:hypothetical protein